MRDFGRLAVWDKAPALVLEVCPATADFPGEEVYGLTSPFRRCAESIPANIAEGCWAATNADFARYLQMAMSSASELEYHLLLARDLEMLEPERDQKLMVELVQVQGMLISLISKVRSAKTSGRRTAFAA